MSLRRGDRKRKPSQLLKESSDGRLTKGRLAASVHLEENMETSPQPPSPPQAPAQQPVVAVPAVVVKVTAREWSFEQGDGVWMRFWPEAEKLMNIAMDTGLASVVIRTGLDRWSYVIDFKTMTQRNRDHFDHRVRKIRFS